ncbi:Uncharacterised protein [Vibrio cholerae]|nr:Uncharacterised protein [Vibrio cholerae]
MQSPVQQPRPPCRPPPRGCQICCHSYLFPPSIFSSRHCTE